MQGCCHIKVRTIDACSLTYRPASEFTGVSVVIYTRSVTQHQPWPTVIIGRSCHKYHFCRDKSICRDKHDIKYTFVEIKDVICRDKIMFSQQKFCRDQHTFDVTNILLSRQKTCFVVLSRQKFCRDKYDTFGSSCQ